VGAIPIGYLVARLLGVDIRQRGSGNIGATNVLRTAGWMPAVVTLLADVAKGYAATWIGSRAGLGFRGGKGVATGLGAFLRITPWALVPAAAVWIALVASLRFVSLASICAVAGLPVAILALGYPPALALAGLAVAVIIIGRHHENLGRLLAGKESRFGERAAAASVPAPPPTGDHR
jgi:glycerol-3-phosphate acyltransferase PlsY